MSVHDQVKMAAARAGEALIFSALWVVLRPTVAVLRLHHVLLYGRAA